MRGLSDNSAFDTFERMSQKVDQIEAESEASAELGGELAGDTLQQKFKKLEAAPGRTWRSPSSRPRWASGRHPSGRRCRARPADAATERADGK